MVCQINPLNGEPLPPLKISILYSGFLLNSAMVHWYQLEISISITRLDKRMCLYENFS